MDSKLEKILEGNEPNFLYYSSQGGSSTPYEFGQRSIKYGNDRYHFGDSKEPFVTSEILPIESDDVAKTGGRDIVIRGGVILRGKSALLDAERLGKWFTSTPGLVFIAKQNLLERQQARPPKLKGIENPFPVDGELNSYQPTRIYNPVNTLLQLAGNVTGLHGMGKGLLPYIPYTSTYNYLQKNKYNDVEGLKSSNRIGNLYISKILKEPSEGDQFWGVTYGEGEVKTLLKYSGGPQSVGGLTNSIYKRVTNTTYTDQLLKNNSTVSTANYSTMDGGLLASISMKSRNFGNGKIYNFIDDIIKSNDVYSKDSPAAKSLFATDYDKFNRISTFQMGDPGKSGLNRTDPYGEGITNNNQKTTDNASNAPTVDKINFQTYYSSGSVNFELLNQDTVPFMIKCLDNSNSENSTYIHFRAFIEGFQDNFTSNWTPHKFMGRGEDFYTYEGFSRNFNLAFKVHAQSKQELTPMYDKLNYLASLMAPDYTNGFMRGNLIQLTIGNYLVGVTGILTALNYAVQPNYSWDIGMDKDGKRISKVLPTLIDVSSFGFTPIHNFVPQKGAPFINNSPNEFTPTQTQ